MRGTFSIVTISGSVPSTSRRTSLSEGPLGLLGGVDTAAVRRERLAWGAAGEDADGSGWATWRPARRP